MVNLLNQEQFDITVQTVHDRGVYKEKLAAHVRYKSIVKCKNRYLLKLLSYLVQFVLPPCWVYDLFVRDVYDVEVAFLEGVPAKILSGKAGSKVKRYAWIHTDMYEHFDAHKKIYKDVKNTQKCIAALIK